MRAMPRACLRMPRLAAARRPTWTAAQSRPRASLCRCLSSSSSAPSPAQDGSSKGKTPAAAAAHKPPPAPQTPQPFLDLKHIRENVDLHAANCERRKYGEFASHPQRILELHGQWQLRGREARALEAKAQAVRRTMMRARDDVEADEVLDEAADGAAAAATAPSSSGGSRGKKIDVDRDASLAPLLEQARVIKLELAAVRADENRLMAEMSGLALALPNLTSPETPDTVQRVLSYIGCDGEEAAGRPSGDGAGATLTTPDRWRSHVHIGAELGLVDFAAAATASGWGWYYLLADGARLEQALVQYALTVAHRHGWQLVSPPSVVRTGIAAACGFQPRSPSGETQTYSLDGLPMSLTATAEIPLAALYADTQMDAVTTRPPASSSSLAGAPSTTCLPIRRAAVSRCYRAEAGARGASTKGLYRVHEFTKVELFAWTPDNLAAATETFDELVDVQTEILSGLGLPCRVLEMPATDLGASAYRKIDIEAFFPSRCRARRGGPGGEGAGNSPDDYDFSTGWGEVTSASICTDYQTRRLATRARIDGGPLTFPWTLNGTALAVPRVLAALLENGWDEESRTVAIPECLQPWMDGQDKIEAKRLR